MCGRFALARCPDELTRLFDLAECADFTPRYNIAPGTDIPVIRRSPTHQNVLHRLRWGLVPHWSTDPTIGSRLINARSECLTEKPSFRSAFARHRCLFLLMVFMSETVRAQPNKPVTGEVALIHDRMPLIIQPEDVEAWLTGTPEEVQKLLRPASYGILRSWPVRRNVNRVQEEGSQLIEPITLFLVQF